MRDLLEKSGSARVAVVVVAGLCVLSLVQAAAAHNDIDMREVFRSSAPQGTPAVTVQPTARSAASRASPTARLPRLAAHRTQRQERRVAERRQPVRHVAGRAVPLDIHLATLPPSRGELFESPAQSPAIISIYEDQTLRHGDAVMMRDGLHVFNGQETGAHRAADFVVLAQAPRLDWHLRKTLSAFDANPPDRWRS